MTSRRLVLLATGSLAAATPGLAAAYIGPGAGLSAIGTILALIGALLLGIVGFVWYPIKRLLAKRKEKQGKLQSAAKDADT